MPRDEWHWQLFLQIPEGLPTAAIDSDDRIKVIDLHEGLAVQSLHIGAYADEPKTLAEMDRFMAREGLEPNGRHHEIYLSPVTDDPSEGRTILGQPVRRRDD